MKTSSSPWLTLILILTMGLLTACSGRQTEVTSPDGHIRLSFLQDDSLRMLYRVEVDGVPFILPSRLGFEERSGLNLSHDFHIEEVKHGTLDEHWSQPWGENKRHRNHYNEMAVALRDEAGTRLTLRFRLFDDGLGFRYECEAPGADSLLIVDELTEFRLAQEATSWSIPASFETYELLYRTLPLSQVETANTPITFRTSPFSSQSLTTMTSADAATEEVPKSDLSDDNHPLYASIHEAALTDYPEMTLVQTDSLAFRASLAPWPDGVKARFAEGVFKTPWRTVQITREAVGLINSSLILNLNEPCALDSTDWIRPMKYVGVWWGMHLGIESWVMGDRHGATTENAIKYIDFAERNGIEAVLFEGWNAGWENWGGSQLFDYTKPFADFDMEKIAQYAREKGVRLIGHHETGGNVVNYESQLDKSFAWYAQYGVHDVKTGYAGGLPNGHNHHGQYNVRHYRHVVETAAKYHTTINAHEPIKDTGIRRTWPNMMTREGARGMEWNAWSEGNPPEHHVLLPFTRLLGGPMDYTPGIFDLLYERAKKSPDRKQWNMKDSKDCRINTTLAKQIALWVILYSPMQMASDCIENYEGHPAFQFFRDFEADCDASRALQGEPGEYVAIVRQAGEKFFLGAATNGEARTLQLPLDFLKPGVSYRATIYADASDADWVTRPLAYTITEQEVTSADTLSAYLAPGGGQAISFLPTEQ